MLSYSILTPLSRRILPGLAFTYDIFQQPLNHTETRSKFYRLFDEAAISHGPITTEGKRDNAVLISEDDQSLAFHPFVTKSHSKGDNLTDILLILCDRFSV
jgi:hypothetical protein